MGDLYQQNTDGSWSEATPLGPQGWRARLEFWCRKRGLNRIANALGDWEERGW